MIISNVNVITNSESVYMSTAKFLYFCNVSGSIKIKDSLQSNTLLLQLTNTINSNEPIEVNKAGNDITLKKNHQLLIVAIEGLASRVFKDEKLRITMNHHLRYIRKLLASAITSRVPINEIEAALSIIDSVFEVNLSKGNFDIIRECILSNCNNANFNLDRLSKEVFMSKRKIQYCLRERNATFKGLVTGARLGGLVSMIEAHPDMPLNSLVKNAGFPSLSSAGYYFFSNFDVKLHDYQSFMKSKSNISYRSGL